MKAFVGFLLMQLFLVVYAQESVDPRQGVNTGMHCGIALAICFSILATCTVSVNLIHRNCKCARTP